MRKTYIFVANNNDTCTVVAFKSLKAEDTKWGTREVNVLNFMDVVS